MIAIEPRLATFVDRRLLTQLPRDLSHVPVGVVRLDEAPPRVLLEQHVTVVSALSRNALLETLRPWRGEIVKTLREESGGPAIHLVQIDADAPGLPPRLESRMPPGELGDQSRWRASSKRAASTLAAAAEIDALEAVKAGPAWAQDSRLLGTRFIDHPNVHELVVANCGSYLSQAGKWALARALDNPACMLGGSAPDPTGGLNAAACQLVIDSALELQRQGEACRPQPRGVDLRKVQEGGVADLPDGRDRMPYEALLTLPDFATHVEWDQSAGPAPPAFVNLRLGQVIGGQVGLSSSNLPHCVQTAEYPIAVTVGTGAGARVVKYTLRLPIAPGPIRWEVPPYTAYGQFNFHFVPGQPGTKTLCIAGSDAPVSWQWIPDSGAQPAWLSLLPRGSGDNRVDFSVTAPQPLQDPITGRVRAQQPGAGAAPSPSVAEVGVVMTVSVIYREHGSARLCGGPIDVAPGESFDCQLPQPLGISDSDYDWRLAQGHALPPGLHLTQAGRIHGGLADNEPLRGWPLRLGLHLRDSRGVFPATPADERAVEILIGAPVRVLTQNTMLVPSIHPFSGSFNAIELDNIQRANRLLDVVNRGDFDIVALQEVFDEEQREQIELGHQRMTSQGPGYRLFWGPDTEESGFCEESGLALLVKQAPGPIVPAPNHSGQEFPISCAIRPYPPFVLTESIQTYCEWGDCLAYKGFTWTKVFFGKNEDEFIWVVNTHMQASEADGQREPQRQGVRGRQLARILGAISAEEFRTHPVLLVGDTNVPASRLAGSEYGRLFATPPNEFALTPPLLQGWEDPIAQKLGTTPDAKGLRGPYTFDTTRSAYAHFLFSGGDHLFHHLAARFARDHGRRACESVPLSPSVWFPPFPGYPGIFLEPWIAGCRGQFEHPTARKQLDHIWLRQGTQFRLRTDAARLEDQPYWTPRCQAQFPMSSPPGLSCYLADHFGLSATFRLLRNATP